MASSEQDSSQPADRHADTRQQEVQQQVLSASACIAGTENTGVSSTTASSPDGLAAPPSPPLLSQPREAQGPLEAESAAPHASPTPTTTSQPASELIRDNSMIGEMLICNGGMSRDSDLLPSGVTCMAPTILSNHGLSQIAQPSSSGTPAQTIQPGIQPGIVQIFSVPPGAHATQSGSAIISVDPRESRKVRHNLAERRRTNRINKLFNELYQLLLTKQCLPLLSEPDAKGVLRKQALPRKSKAAVLEAAIHCVETLQRLTAEANAKAGLDVVEVAGVAAHAAAAATDRSSSPDGADDSSPSPAKEGTAIKGAALPARSANVGCSEGFSQSAAATGAVGDISSRAGGSGSGSDGLSLTSSAIAVERMREIVAQQQRVLASLRSQLPLQAQPQRQQIGTMPAGMAVAGMVGDGVRVVQAPMQAAMPSGQVGQVMIVPANGQVAMQVPMPSGQVMADPANGQLMSMDQMGSSLAMAQVQMPNGQYMSMPVMQVGSGQYMPLMPMTAQETRAQTMILQQALPQQSNPQPQQRPSSCSSQFQWNAIRVPNSGGAWSSAPAARSSTGAPSRLSGAPSPGTANQSSLSSSQASKPAEAAPASTFVAEAAPAGALAQTMSTGLDVEEFVEELDSEDDGMGDDNLDDIDDLDD